MKPESRHTANIPDTNTVPAKTPLASFAGLSKWQRLLVIICAAAMALAVFFSMGCSADDDHSEEIEYSATEVANFCRDYGVYTNDYDILPSELDNYSGAEGSREYEDAQNTQKDGIMAASTDDSAKKRTLQINGNWAYTLKSDAYIKKLTQKDFTIDTTKSKGDSTTTREYRYLTRGSIIIEFTHERYDEGSFCTIAITMKQTP